MRKEVPPALQNTGSTGAPLGPGSLSLPNPLPRSSSCRERPKKGWGRAGSTSTCTLRYDLLFSVPRWFPGGSPRRHSPGEPLLGEER